jgi:hypothetical protein
MSEKFRRGWWGWIRSSEGFEVRIMGRNDLQYRDAAQHLHLFVEPLANWNDIVLDKASIPDTGELPTSELIQRLRRAFTARGWNLILDGEDHQ